MAEGTAPNNVGGHLARRLVEVRPPRARSPPHGEPRPSPAAALGGRGGDDLVACRSRLTWRRLTDPRTCTVGGRRDLLHGPGECMHLDRPGWTRPRREGRRTDF